MEDLFTLEKQRGKNKFGIDLPACTIDEVGVLAYSIGVKVPKPRTETPEARRSALEIALRNFKRKVTESGIIDELKDRGEYLKPSVRKRKIKLNAIRQNELNKIISKRTGN